MSDTAWPRWSGCRAARSNHSQKYLRRQGAQGLGFEVFGSITKPLKAGPQQQEQPPARARRDPRAQGLGRMPAAGGRNAGPQRHDPFPPGSGQQSPEGLVRPQAAGALRPHVLAALLRRLIQCMAGRGPHAQFRTTNTSVPGQVAARDGQTGTVIL